MQFFASSNQPTMLYPQFATKRVLQTNFIQQPMHQALTLSFYSRQMSTMPLQLPADYFLPAVQVPKKLSTKPYYNPQDKELESTLYIPGFISNKNFSWDIKSNQNVSASSAEISQNFKETCEEMGLSENATNELFNLQKQNEQKEQQMTKDSYLQKQQKLLKKKRIKPESQTQILQANEIIWNCLYSGEETDQHKKKNAIKFRSKLKKLGLYQDNL